MEKKEKEIAAKQQRNTELRALLEERKAKLEAMQQDVKDRRRRAVRS